MRRGEVWWAELAEEAGFRPVVIVSADATIPGRSSITIAEVTRVVRSIPSEVLLSTDDGMPTDCVINIGNLQTISKDRLREKITALSEEKLFALSRALHYSLDLEW